MNKNELEQYVKERVKDNPSMLMGGFIVDVSTCCMSKIIDLVNKYKAHNIDVVPISEIEQVIKESYDHALRGDGLIKKLLS